MSSGYYNKCDGCGTLSPDPEEIGAIPGGVAIHVGYMVDQEVWIDLCPQCWTKVDNAPEKIKTAILGVFLTTVPFATQDVVEKYRINEDERPFYCDPKSE